MLNDTNSDYVKEILDGANSICQEKGISLFVFNIGEMNFSYHPFDYQHRILTKFCHKANIDGLIVCSAVLDLHSKKEEFEAFLKGFGSLPIVSIGSKISGRPSVLCDPKPGIQTILEDLVTQHKCKKICILGKIPGSHEAVERTEIIASFLQKKGIRFDDRFVIGGNFTYEGAIKPLEDYWEDKGAFDFDAVMALNDDMAFAALDFCARHKIKVPDQVRVAGFDNVPRAMFSHPPLTTVSQDLVGQGRAAVESLLLMLDKKRVSGEIYINTNAIFRESSSGFNADSKSENSGRRVGTEWLDKKNQFYILNDFLISGQTRLNIPRMRKYFIDNIERFGVTAAALCLYERPLYLSDKESDFALPDKAFVYSSFDTTKNYTQNLNAEPMEFNPSKTILPPDLLDLSFGMYQTAILSKREVQYGYMVFRCGPFEPLIYSMMGGNFARLVSEAWEASKSEKAGE